MNCICCAFPLPDGALYCPMCGRKPKDREYIIGTELIAYKDAQEHGRLNSSCPICDIDYVEQQWDRLLKQP